MAFCHCIVYDNFACFKNLHQSIQRMFDVIYENFSVITISQLYIHEETYFVSVVAQYSTWLQLKCQSQLDRRQLWQKIVYVKKQVLVYNLNSYKVRRE